MPIERSGHLDEVKIDIDLERDETENKMVMNPKIHFIGNLDDEQRKRLLAVANACPVYKTHQIEINTST